ncbi:MAG TPA: KH domain-containing protein [Anaerolineales bacterium]|nr:KH domain-containing protein [Anaerolineales bacterium]
MAAKDSAGLKALVEFVARSLVDDPTEVRVSERMNQGEVQLELEVAPEDMGRVIGRSGKVASAMRTLLRVAAVKRGVRATLDIR